MEVYSLRNGWVIGQSHNYSPHLHTPPTRPPPSSRPARPTLVNDVHSFATVHLLPGSHLHINISSTSNSSFILGQPDPDAESSAEQQEEEYAVAEAQTVQGDVVRLEGLVGGENMNNGKT